MTRAIRSILTLTAGVALLLPVTACGIDVRGAEQGTGKNVDIRTPVGALSVRTDVKNPDTGLAVYPGAQPFREDGREPESANVNISSSWFGVKVVAAKFESVDAQEKVLAFYRQEMKAFGDVTECRGEVDFRNRLPVCKENAYAREIQLVTGTEERQRIVVVKPRGSGAEFALVYVDTRG
jgi:hypothetical protein